MLDAVARRRALSRRASFSEVTMLHAFLIVSLLRWMSTSRGTRVKRSFRCLWKRSKVLRRIRRRGRRDQALQGAVRHV